MKLLSVLLLSVLGLTIVGSSVYDSFTEKTRFEILSKQRLFFTPSFNKTRKVASSDKVDYKAIFLKKNPRNIARINGVWAISFYEKSGNKSEIIIPNNPEQVVVIMVEDSSIVMTNNNASKKLKLIDVQRGVIRAFTENSDSAEYYELSLIRLAQVVPPARKNIAQRIVRRTSKVVTTTASANEEVTELTQDQGQDVYLELKEAYDVVSKKIVKAGIQGEIDIVNGKVNSINASINDREIFPTNINEENKGLYNYEANGTVGSFQGTYVNGSDYNIYFTDGAYKGYTLIFSRTLTAQEQYEKEEVERKRLQAEYDNITTIAESELEAPLEKQQVDAVRQREEIAQLRNPANNFDNEFREEASLFLSDTKDIALRAARGEDITAEEAGLLEEREEIIGDMGGVNFSTF